MELDRGTKFGSYEILTRVAVGRRGEVYQALDALLGRQVAIKLLPLHLAEDPQEWRRVQREAEALSLLNHPNICAIHEAAQYDSQGFLVMEWLEGETLAARMSRGLLAEEELLAVAIQIADALDEAHRAGLVHGNLTPGHVLLTPEGAKLIGFSLSRDDVLFAGNPLASPMLDGQTASPAGADALRYASPEQINGKPADARSDIFSFGTLLYEMTSGRQAFWGETPARVAAAVREKDPTPISLLEPSVPLLDPVLRACMAKEPEERFQSAHDLKLQLEWVRDGAAVDGSANTKRSRNRERVAWLVAAAAVIVATALVAAALLRHESVARPARVRAEINLPEGLTLGQSNDSLALSPNGSELVIAATDAAGKRQLWVRSTDAPSFRPLVGTAGATFPFWSPEGNSIGFFAGGQLKRINLATGDAFTICAAPDGRGGTWNRQGMIVFAPLPFGGLYRVSASGGTPIQVSVPEKASMTQRLPDFLPGGRRLLFYSGVPGPGSANGIYVLDLTSGKSQLLLRATGEGRYVAPGYLAFVRDGNLMVQRFHASRLTLTGQPFPIVSGISFNPRAATAEYAFSKQGLIVYQLATPPPPSRLTWFSLNGEKLATVGKPAPFSSVSVLPGGHEAIAQTEDGNGHTALWIYDLESGQRRRFDPGETTFQEALWSPDERQVAFADGRGNVVLKTASGSGPSRKVFSLQEPWSLSAWSANGRLLILNVLGAGGWDVWMLPVRGKQKPYPFLQTPYNEYDGTFSANGRWLSYISDASGRSELYVVGYPRRGAPLQVSTKGAVLGGWVPRQSELAYVTAQAQLVIIKVRTTENQLQLGKPEVALRGHSIPGIERYPGPRPTPANFFSRNGKRVLLAVPVAGRTSEKLTLLTDWKAATTKL